MRDIKKFIVIPVYNDWKSLNRLLKELDKSLRRSFRKVHILVINDKSSEKISIPRKTFISISKIEVFTVSRNVGSQKSISLALHYLSKLKSEFVITVMDSDGEDDPNQVSKMTKMAIKYENFVITSNRKNRKESRIIIFLYYIHLLMTFLFTFKWISFGNFTSLHCKNLKNLLSNNSSNYAHSSAVIQNCKIKRIYAKRKKRYFDKSKLSLISLIEHSIRVNAVFFKNVALNSLVYIFLSFIFLPSFLFKFLLVMILLFNILVIFIKIRYEKISGLSFKKSNI